MSTRRSFGGLALLLLVMVTPVRGAGPAGVVARLGAPTVAHTGAVHCVVCAPDGKSVASAGEDRVIRLWEPDSGREIRRFAGHEKTVLSLSFSPDGATLASGCAGGEIRLWDVATGKPLPALPSDHNCVCALACSPDGKWLVSTGRTQAVCVWDVAAGRKLRELTSPGKHFLCLAVAPDGRSVIAGCKEGTICRWDLATGQELPAVGSHENAVESVAFAPDGQRLASGGADRAVCVWDLRAGTQLWRQANHVGTVTSVRFTPAARGRQVISVCSAGHVRWWEASTGDFHRVCCDGWSHFTTLAVSPDGRTLFTGRAAGSIYRWDTDSGKGGPVSGRRSEVRALVFARDRKSLLTFANDGHVRTWDLASGREERCVWLRTGILETAVLSPDGAFLAGSRGKEFAVLWETASGNIRDPFSGYRPLAWGPAFAPRERIVALCAPNGVGVWDMDIGKSLLLMSRPKEEGLEVPAGDFHTLAVAPNEKVIACGSSTGTIEVWDLEQEQGSRRYSIPALTSKVEALAFSPDSRLLAAAGAAGELFVWDLQRDGTQWRRVIIADFASLAWTHDGHTLAVAYQDGTVRLLERETGRERGRFDSGQGGLAGAWAAPGGPRLALAGRDTTILIVDLLVQGAGPDKVNQPPAALVEDLAGEDAGRGWTAVCRLAAAPEQALPLLRQTLARAQAVSERIRTLIAQLDDDDFDAREEAAAALGDMLELAEDVLREELKKSIPLEVRRRIQQVLNGHEIQPPSPELLRQMRALEALELMHTAGAKTVLEKLASGALEAWLTRQAKFALDRW
jgi:WD40 repeat protein